MQTLIFSIHKLCCVLFFIGALHAKSSNILEIHRIRNLRAKKSTKLDIWQNSIWIFLAYLNAKQFRKTLFVSNLECFPLLVYDVGRKTRAKSLVFLLYIHCKKTPKNSNWEIVFSTCCFFQCFPL